MEETRAPVKVVIADDDAAIIQLLTVGFSHDPRLAVVATAGDGTEALAVVEARHPEVAILDITMPGLTGIEVGEAIRARGLRTSVIYFTSRDDEAVLASAAATGGKVVVKGGRTRIRELADMVVAAAAPLEPV